MATELENQARSVRMLLVQLRRTQSVFDPASNDYTMLQGIIEQILTRLNELRQQLGDPPLPTDDEINHNPFLNPRPNPNP